MSRRTRTLYAGLALVALTAACSDSSVAPRSASSRQTTASLSPSTRLPSPALTSTPLYTTISVNPWTSTVYDVEGGVHKIFFQAGAVCDPTVSSYGMTEWNKPCTPANRTITVTAKSYRDVFGNPVVEFSPALRFVPDKYVVLYMNDTPAVNNAWAGILYCPDYLPCVDESLLDSSLATYRDPDNGFILRRIKHFSGYMVGASKSDEITTTDAAM